MTHGPYLLPGARQGFRYGGSEIVDSTEQTPCSAPWT